MKPTLTPRLVSSVPEMVLEPSSSNMPKRARLAMPNRLQSVEQPVFDDAQNPWIHFVPLQAVVLGVQLESAPYGKKHLFWQGAE